MGAVEDLIGELKSKYGGTIPFERICADEGIVAVKAPLDEGVRGFYVVSNGHKVIVLNAKLKHSERRDWAFHELWHHFRSPSSTKHSDRRDERRADLFAALCRIPNVREDDDLHSLVERFSVSRELARIRIEYEAR